MKQKIEIEIDVPYGKKAVLKDGKVIFEDVTSGLPTTWREFCNKFPVSNMEYCIKINSHIIKMVSSERDEREDRNILPNEKAAEQHLALMQLHQLRDCYRQGWVPSYLYEEQKYNINDDAGLIGINCTNKRVSFLSFPTLELAEQFLKNFRCLIIQAGDLI